MATSSTSQIGSLAQVHFWNTALSPDAWTKFGQLKSIGEIGSDRPEVPVTDLDSLAVERIGGIPDGLQCTLDLYANTTTLGQVETLYNANVNFDIKVVFPAPLSATRYFTLTPLGFRLGPTVEPDAPLMATLTGRISSAISSTPSHA